MPTKQEKEQVAELLDIAKKARELRKATGYVSESGQNIIPQKEIFKQYYTADGFDRNDHPDGFHYYFEDRTKLRQAAGTGREVVTNPTTHETETYGDSKDVLMRMPTKLYEEELREDAKKNKRHLTAQRKHDLESPVVRDTIEEVIEPGKMPSREAQEEIAKIEADRPASG